MLFSLNQEGREYCLLRPEQAIGLTAKLKRERLKKDAACT
jgi:hypothetical protein